MPHTTWRKHRPHTSPAGSADCARVRWEITPHMHAAGTVSPCPGDGPPPLSRPLRSLSALALSPTWRENRGPSQSLPAPTQLSTSGTVAGAPRLTLTASARLLLAISAETAGAGLQRWASRSRGPRGVEGDWPLSPGDSLGRPPSPWRPTLPLSSAQLPTVRIPRSSTVGLNSCCPCRLPGEPGQTVASRATRC